MGKVTAATNIKHDDLWFAAGDEVTGLDDDVMERLNEAGALEGYGDEEEEAAPEEEEQPEETE